ncbi:hypothetical protein XENTR_v10023599 [Xenopus tropicalis]|nr:hypothetical protein XENTR_v10023599 [Xenopus tropicalis]
MFSRFRKRFIKIFKSNNRDSNDILAVPSCPRELVIKPVEEQVVSEPTVQEHLTREINASTKHKLSKVLLRETLIIAHNKAEEEARKEILKRKLENVQLREKARIQEKETQMEVQRQTEKRMKEKELWVSLANATQEEDKKELMKRKVRNIMLLEKLKAEDRETEVQVQRQREERQREIERWKALEKEAQEENNREIRKRKERNLLLNKNMEMEKEQKLKNIEQQRRMKELELEAQKKDDAAMREEIAMQQPKEMEIIRSTEEEAQKLSGPSEQSPDDVPVDKQKDAGSQKASPPISLPGEEEQTEEESEKPEAANQDQNKSVTRKKEKKMKIRRGKPQDSCVDVPKVSKMRTPYCQVVAKLDKALNMMDLDSSMAQYEPPRIEDFQLQSFLGEGSFGKVYKAQHRETGEIIALKTLALCEMNDTSVFKCVALEQRILRLVSERQWPFLTGLVCSFQTEHYMCLGMEYAEGGTLDSYLSEGGLPLERVR